jgi:hypothetical protein
MSLCYLQTYKRNHSADKGGYASYFNMILELDLLAPRGIILLDNTLYTGSPWIPHPHLPGGDKLMHGVNQLVLDNPTMEVVLLPIRDGITIARRRDEERSDCNGKVVIESQSESARRPTTHIGFKFLPELLFGLLFFFWYQFL